MWLLRHAIAFMCTPPELVAWLLMVYLLLLLLWPHLVACSLGRGWLRAGWCACDAAIHRGLALRCLKRHGQRHA